MKTSAASNSICVDYFLDHFFEEKLPFTNQKHARLALGKFGSALSPNPLRLYFTSLKNSLLRFTQQKFRVVPPQVLRLRPLHVL
jgi:hypothetical protein